MSRERAYVVLNPVAGISSADQLEQTITQGLHEAGWSYEIHRTEENEDVATKVRAAVREDGYSMVIATGGDGTVSAAANGLVGIEIPLGIVPSGTGNALARDMGIPLRTADAIALITGPHRRKAIDALAYEGRHYFLNLSVGVSAAAMADTGRGEKRRLGIIAYLITGVQKLVGLQPAGFELTIDGAHRYVHAADIVVTNTGIIGISALELVPDNAVDDGEVTVCIIRARTLFDYISALINTLLHRPRDRQLECVPARERIEIESTRPLPVQADGEPIGQGNATVEVVPHAVELVLPQDDDHNPNSWWRFAQR